VQIVRSGTLDELAQMVARGFEATASKKMVTEAFKRMRQEFEVLRSVVGSSGVSGS